MAVTAIAGLIAAGVGIYSVAHNAHQANLAKKAAAANVMPKYTIPQSEYDNLSLAESRANQGFGDSALQAYQQQSDRGLSSSINAILKGGGNANAISNLYDSYANNLGNLAIQNDRVRLQNLNTLMQARQRMGDEQDKSYQVNQYAPWADRAQAYNQQLQTANAGVSQGIQLAANGISSAATSFGKGMAGNQNGVSTEGATTGYNGGGSGIGLNNPNNNTYNSYMGNGNTISPEFYGMLSQSRGNY